MGQSFKFMGAGVTGQKELDKLFKELPETLTKNAMYATGRKALAPVAKDAKAAVRSQSTAAGDLAKSIRVSTRAKNQRRDPAGQYTVYAGPTTPSGAHGHLIEFGTSMRQTKSGANRGRVTPEPFMRPAWDANAHKVLKIMRTEIWEQLKKQAARLRTRAESGKLSKRDVKFFGG